MITINLNTLNLKRVGVHKIKFVFGVHKLCKLRPKNIPGLQHDLRT